MNVIVCVKQIPDPANPGALDPSTNTLKRDGKLILDESDSYGVEMALQLVDKAGGGEVTLVSMAPNGEVSGLRTALAASTSRRTPPKRSSSHVASNPARKRSREEIEELELVIVPPGPTRAPECARPCESARRNGRTRRRCARLPNHERRRLRQADPGPG